MTENTVQSTYRSITKDYFFIINRFWVLTHSDSKYIVHSHDPKYVYFLFDSILVYLYVYLNVFYRHSFLLRFVTFDTAETPNVSESTSRQTAVASNKPSPSDSSNDHTVIAVNVYKHVAPVE